MELVQELVETILLTGRLRKGDPVSLLLIAAPESGKTSVVLYRPCANAVVMTDVTGKGLQAMCQMKPEISHFIINDMLALGAKKQSVKQFTISMLCAMTEEGIRSVAYPGTVETFANGKRGVVACIPSTLVHDGRAWWNRAGFTSRMLPFAFKHSAALTITIKNAIDTGLLDEHWKQNGKDLILPTLPCDVMIPAREVKHIREEADSVARELGEEIGYRRLHQWRAIARAHAVRRSWKKPIVLTEDIQFLKRIRPFISYTKCEAL